MLMMRHQLTVLGRKSPKRLTLSNFNRLDFASLENAPLGANIAQGIDIFWD
jgi:hypothetical protein